MIHERISGYFSVYGLSVPDLADPCVFNVVENEGLTDMLSVLMKLEIEPQRFVDGIGAGADNRSGVVRDDWVDNGPCGRVKHLVLLRFVGSFRL